MAKTKNQAIIHQSTQISTILTQLENTISSTAPDDPKHKQAFEEYMKLLDLDHRNMIETRKLDVEERRQKFTENNETEKLAIESAKLNLDSEKLSLDRQKFDYQKSIEDPNGSGTISAKIQADQLRQERKYKRLETVLRFLGGIGAALCGITTTIYTIDAGNKLAAACMEYENDGSIKSYTAKTLIGDFLKRKPRH